MVATFENDGSETGPTTMEVKKWQKGLATKAYCSYDSLES